MSRHQQWSALTPAVAEHLPPAVPSHDKPAARHGHVTLIAPGILVPDEQSNEASWPAAAVIPAARRVMQAHEADAGMDHRPPEVARRSARVHGILPKAATRLTCNDREVQGFRAPPSKIPDS